MSALAETLGRPAPRAAAAACFHCGTVCPDQSLVRGEKAFCCHGCLAVFELLSANGLGDFYDLADTAGVRVKATRADQFRYLDEPLVRERLVNFQDARITRVTLRIPSIHCIACVWLLENLHRLSHGIGASQVNFPRKEISITFENASVNLGELVALLASLGYEPELKLSDLDARPRQPETRRLWMQLGVAGFAFGNLMLLAIGVYFGVDAFSGPTFHKLAGYIGLVLAIPVVTYSAGYYWRTAWTSLKQSRLAIEVPIAAGIVAIFVQSAYEVLKGVGEGYFDSLSGLIFFLLCGRLFQLKTFERLSFERDYESFFPLSVMRRTPLERASISDTQEQVFPEERIALSQLRVGDIMLIRHGELIPADARVVAGEALIDYSFVTGEAEPVPRRTGDHLYAGGRQMGGLIEVEMVKPVSQSYLTSLWNQEAFRKEKSTFETLINAYSYRFTLVVSMIAIGAAVFWALIEPGKSLKAFTSVLIVACPCALALAAPFTLGTAMRALGRRNVFVKSIDVIEAMARVDTIVFDKTGTLTAAGARSIVFMGKTLSDDEQRRVFSLAHHSTHPLSVRVADSLRADIKEPVRSFAERAGCGIEGIVAGREILMGSAAWLSSRGVLLEHDLCTSAGPGVATNKKDSAVHLAIGGVYRGCFALENALRSRVGALIRRLSTSYELALLSGDNERQRDAFAPLFGEQTRFQQTPLDKLEFVHGLQRNGRAVMMVGDGLNDAGALKQSDVGVAVVESVSAFSPASDVIMSAGMVPQLDGLLRFSRRAARIVRAGFVFSSLYNVVGVSIAAAGLLSPVVCAILMPLSSISIVLFSCGMTAWAARRELGDRANLGATAARDGEFAMAE